MSQRDIETTGLTYPHGDTRAFYLAFWEWGWRLHVHMPACTHISSSLTETLRLAHYCLIVYQELRRQLGKWEEEVKSPQRKAPACDARALTESHCSHVPPGSHLRLVLPRPHAHSSLVSTPSQCSQHRFARSFRAHTESGMHLLLARCRVLLTADYLGTKLWREMYGCL